MSAGCNIGSFGSGATGVSVENVLYSDVTISNSEAGVELKSYPNCAGTVRNITYTGFTLVRALCSFE
jgi:rhamnogalacturonan hydrolase